MKYFTGFMMAWGNFCSLPCPSKRWDQNYQSLMLGFLPLVGLIIGIIWAACYFALVYIGFPFLAASFLISIIPFALCGFMHMDGFMDCCDAIMSRRPLAERQRILKDSSAGAFAVVGMIFFVLGYFCFLSTAVTTGVDFVNMVMIVVMSRAVSGLHVLIAKPMAQSQYAGMEGEKTGAKAGILLLLALLTIIAAAAFLCSSLRLATLIVCGFTALGCLVSIQYAKKNLGGMSGDIAGYGILWGELMGVFSLVLC